MAPCTHCRATGYVEVALPCSVCNGTGQRESAGQNATEPRAKDLGR
jgi:RecJ-like exonuclease